jgi:CHASE3 domain sensor protein
MNKKTLTNKQVVALLVFIIGVFFSAVGFVRIEEKAYNREAIEIKKDVSEARKDIDELKLDIKSIYSLLVDHIQFHNGKKVPEPTKKKVPESTKL